MTRFTKVGLIALVAAAATIWLLPSASVGRSVDLERAEAELRAATQRVGTAVQEAVAPVREGLQATKQKTKTALSATKSSATKSTRATATDPPRQPPLHGTDPHGQGSVAVVDLNPSAERPLSGDPDGGDSGEDVVVGRARGEKTANGYHGHITILGLFGNEIGGVDTTPGETKNGPLQPLQAGVLDPLCTATGNQLCLSVLTANSATTATGSTNDFALARAQVVGLGVGAAESRGTISEPSQCQTSAGGAMTANVASRTGVVAGAANSAATSTSCRGQAPQVSRTSQVIQLGGTGIALPAAGCANGTPDTVVEIPLVATLVCNADELSGAAVVREALDVFVLNVGGNSLVKETTAAAEAVSRAEAAGPQCADGVDNDGDGLIDAADPGCHTDGNPNNPASYDATDNSERDSRRTGGSGGERAAAECSDNRDNDGDGRIDEADPGCHTDGNPNNPASYNPDDDDESDDADAAGAGAGGGAGDGAGTGAGADDTLPFTGSNLVGLVLAGLLVLAGGLVLRRREDALPQA